MNEKKSENILRIFPLSIYKIKIGLTESERDILNAPEIIATYTKILEDPNVTPDDVIEYQRIISNAEAIIAS